MSSVLAKEILLSADWCNESGSEGKPQSFHIWIERGNARINWSCKNVVVKPCWILLRHEIYSRYMLCKRQYCHVLRRVVNSYCVFIRMSKMQQTTVLCYDTEANESRGRSCHWSCNELSGNLVKISFCVCCIGRLVSCGKLANYAFGRCANLCQARQTMNSSSATSKFCSFFRFCRNMEQNSKQTSSYPPISRSSTTISSNRTWSAS